jgi:hypothetical protein
MKWKTKWLIAIILTGSVFGLSKLEKAGILNDSITHYVSTGDDFIVMKKWVASFLTQPDNELIPVMAEQKVKDLLTDYESMQPYQDGVIVSYTEPLPILARESGLVIYTGFTRKTGKTLTILYDNGDEVTYGFVGKFAKLPYTSVRKGDALAMMDEGAIYLMVSQEGVKLDSSVLPAYLSGPDH